ncbi:MAG: nuclear transport factor 2 family protein, partial [Nocardioidaceae bacterium]
MRSARLRRGTAERGGREEVSQMATAKTPVSEAKIIDVAEAMFRAYNDHDVDSILEHLTDDVVWAEPSIEEPLRGKDAV